jgi:UDP-N-acetyl-2-amino-2-deoxyglucuronate dehydrogenase
MSKSRRVGIIGIGAIARMHAMALRDLPGVELVGGVCRTEAKGRAFAAEFGGRWYADVAAMVDAERPDFVTIATPSGAHLDAALAAIGRGVAVLVEKPMEITLERIDRIIEAAEKRGVLLGGIFPQRYNPVVQQVQRDAAAGRFGSLAVVGVYVPWWRDDAYYAAGRWQGTAALDGGGAMMNQSIHGVDALQWIGGPVESVFAFTAKRGHPPEMIEVEDTAVAVLRFKNGALGQILGATSMWPGHLRRIQVAGRDGFAEVLEEQLITYQFRDPKPGDDAVRLRFAAKSKTEGGASNPMAIDYSNHTRNIAAFIDAMDGKSKLLLDGPESRKAVAIIEAIYESARTGGAVDVK